MAIGALFTPKLARKVHNSHYHQYYKNRDKMKTLQYFGYSVQWLDTVH